jgi:hypothetical protein
LVTDLLNGPEIYDEHMSLLGGGEEKKKKTPIQFLLALEFAP